MLLNTEICSTATCAAEIGDLHVVLVDVPPCDIGYEDICEAYTCCAACSDVGAALISCVASEDGCPQRCTSGARANAGATAALAGGIIAAMAILGSVFFA
jgi:hypothetical protein